MFKITEVVQFIHTYVRLSPLTKDVHQHKHIIMYTLKNLSFCNFTRNATAYALVKHSD